MLIISDIHGCYNTLRRLLKKCPDEAVVFAGDLVDRGPDSASVVKFAMEQKVPTVIGNHEDLMLFYHDRPSVGYEGRDLWLFNGGATTLESWGGTVPDAVLDWVEKLSMQLDVGPLLISHTGVGSSSNRMASLWHRADSDGFPDDGRFRVFGHTQSKFVLLGPSWARIDTGAAYSSKGYGTLSAFQWPERRVFSQKYDESPLEPVISVAKLAA